MIINEKKINVKVHKNAKPLLSQTYEREKRIKNVR